MIKTPSAPLTTPARDALISELRRRISAIANTQIFDVRVAHDNAVLGFLTAIRLMADDKVKDSYAKYCKAGASLLSRLIKENTGIDFTFTCDAMADLEAANETYLKWVFRKPRVATYFAMIMLETFINAAYSTLEEKTAPRESVGTN